MAFEDSAGINVRNHYGPRVINNKFGGELPGDGAVRQVEYVFDYSQLPENGSGEMELLLPDNSTLVDVYFVALEPFIGGTSYDIDLVEKDGTPIGVGSDKIFDALLQSEIDTEGETNLSSTHTGTNSGNALGIAISPSSQLQVSATGAFTTGKARIVIDYLPYKAA